LVHRRNILLKIAKIVFMIQGAMISLVPALSKGLRHELSIMRTRGTVSLSVASGPRPSCVAWSNIGRSRCSFLVRDSDGEKGCYQER